MGILGRVFLVQAVLGMPWGISGAAAQTPPVPNGCSARVEQFCDRLYSPENRGNLDLGSAENKRSIRLGKSENSFDYTVYYYQKAKFEARDRLPKDLLEVLDRKKYFQKLKHYLNSKPYEKMSIEDRARDVHIANEVVTIWNSAFDETIIRRLSKMHPGIHRLTADRIPPKWKHDEQRTRDELSASISRAIWEKNPIWRKVEQDVEVIRNEFLQMFEGDPKWVESLKTVKLLVPGGDPKAPNNSCASTERNAQYQSAHHRIAVCAGQFTTLDSTWVIAHEFAHAVGNTRWTHLLYEESELAKKFRQLKARSCSVDPIPCSEWEKWKKDYQKDVLRLGTLRVKHEDFLTCLQGKKITQSPDDKYLERVAREKAIDDIEPTASSSSFLSMIKEKAKLIDGTSHPNPAFSNPCGLYYWTYNESSLSTWYSLRVFFANEYRCQAAATPEEKLKNSIETAKAMQISLHDRLLRVPGKFSWEKRLKADSYAEDPEEKFADAIGQAVFARVLKKFPNVEDRWNLFLSNIAVNCDPPSWRKEYPSEAQVEKSYYFDPHSEGRQRRLELLTEPVRDALGCAKDFELNECQFKPSPKS